MTDADIGFYCGANIFITETIKSLTRVSESIKDDAPEMALEMMRRVKAFTYISEGLKHMSIKNISEMMSELVVITNDAIKELSKDMQGEALIRSLNHLHAVMSSIFNLAPNFRGK